MYRLVFTAILMVDGVNDVSSMLQIFWISEDGVRAILEPISSIINLSMENAKETTFYHATAKEFMKGIQLVMRKTVFFTDNVNDHSFDISMIVEKKENGRNLWQKRRIITADVIYYLFDHVLA
ncbi:uncharacterized protein EI90DRAFT_3135834 [Cantharellus anzutake]|uniref:uncharacterized protein n=1 Tax=Cantharellus anzutake TaxID=1750568 RepID=UPI001903A831|nr:uncharacterized protein EI90DRAFT_3135834 [Cantharellus anzutake]KAF8314635.1 hypothetical protein EI90DRAFT_3135834 [Cantharellus anzutake]